MAFHWYEGDTIFFPWCPYTGAEGMRDYLKKGQCSWALCIGSYCPKATLQKNTFGNVFLQCGGKFEPDANGVNENASYCSALVKACARRIRHAVEDGRTLDEIVSRVEEEVQNLKLEIEENLIEKKG